jgi:hypothetical protein
MKTILLFIATTFSLSAHALQSHYGQLSYSDGQYVCSYSNSGSAKNFKWVVFDMERRHGKIDNRDFQVRQKVDAIVGTGETITFPSGLHARDIGRACKFLAR